jgi:hypothetical protein
VVDTAMVDGVGMLTALIAAWHGWLARYSSAAKFLPARIAVLRQLRTQTARFVTLERDPGRRFMPELLQS